MPVIRTTMHDLMRISATKNSLIQAQLEQALKTRVGGRSTDKTKGKVKTTSGKATHEEKTRSGMTFASHVWIAGDDRNAQGNVMPLAKDDDVDASLVAARASQRKEKAGPRAAQRREWTNQY